ncbi:glycosyltransferase family 4 protein [Paenibacillus daejeonensis]|uniref:glycosyltransferase family 4 protein n=1 Tax=Paenibacillus daejeonensis TaxID=135193 RepID=UPI00037697D2|nr:glycosyltransferase family 1 protein [Paenibacillus daejeonensis]
MNSEQHIMINGRFLTQSVTGVQRVAMEAVRMLDEMLESGEIDRRQYRFEMLVPPGKRQEVELRHIPVREAGRMSGHLWEQLELPRLTRGKLLVNLCGPAPLAKRQQIVTIHDAAIFANRENFSLVFRSWYRLMFTGFRIASRKVITVSHFSKSEIQRYCGIGERKIAVHHLGVDHMAKTIADHAILAKHGLTPGNYVLAVSSRSPNKNFDAIVKAIRHLGNTAYDCVIVGGANAQVFGQAEVSGVNGETGGHARAEQVPRPVVNQAELAGVPDKPLEEGVGAPVSAAGSTHHGDSHADLIATEERMAGARNGDAAQTPRNRVKLLGYVSDSELKALYEHAGCFIYPSFYEGFGLPPIEAMSCGCPVIVSQAASLPEVCGPHAIYCDPHQYTDLAEKIQQVMGDEALRHSLRERGLAHAEGYRWRSFSGGLFREIVQSG